MANREWCSLLGLLCAVVAVSRGDEVLITTPHVTSSPQGKCVFPDVLSVELTQPGSELGWKIPLKKDNIFPTERTVRFMSETTRDVVEELKVTSNEHDGVQTYHNHHHGAAFLAKCVRRQEERRCLLLEGSVFVNNNKFRVTPSSNWSLSEQVFPNHVTAIYNLTHIEEFHARDANAIFPSSLSYLEKMAARSQRMARHKRDVTLPVTYYIDILVVVDSYFYATFFNRSGGDKKLAASNIMDYLAFLFTAVSMRQDTLQLENRNLKIRLLNPVILEDLSQSPYNSSHLTIDNNQTTLDASILLGLFKGWLVGNQAVGVYDHAMFITALNIAGGTDAGQFNVTKGLAFIGTFCETNGESSSIISDNGAYQSEGVAAHELTHGLGSTHDGVDNNCSSADRYIMSSGTYPETDANRYNPWKYSSCSSLSVLNLLKELEMNATMLQNCLKDSNGTDKTVNKTLSADEQCTLYFGNESFVCRGANVSSIDTICDEFYCGIPGTSTCERLMAATGTCCGTQKKCSQGQCVAAMQGECPQNDSCLFGDQKDVIVRGQTCAQLNSSFCYDPNVRLRCCHACQHRESQNPDCLYGDKELNCQEDDCGAYFSNGDYKDLPYAYVCCATCKSNCTDQDVTLKSGVKMSCNQYIIGSGNRSACYNKDVFNACCKTCQGAMDASNVDCPWGYRSNCSGINALPPGYYCFADSLKQCCPTCTLLPTTTTTSVAPSTGGSQNQAVTTCKPTDRCGATANTSSVLVMCLIAAVYCCLVKLAL